MRIMNSLNSTARKTLRTVATAATTALCSWMLVATAATAERLTVPLSDPAKPAELEVSLVMGSIQVTGTATREVVVEARSRAEDAVDRGKEKDLPGDRVGMRRIPNTAIGLEAEEEGNKVSISAESWARWGARCACPPSTTVISRSRTSTARWRSATRTARSG
jgi:hypothetical protein